VILEGSPTDGIHPSGITETRARPEPLDLPAFIDLSTVAVRRMVRADLSDAWQTKARIDSHPWIAERILPADTAGRPPTRIVWLASRPTGESDWAADRSFVLYFADLLRRTLSPSEASSGPSLLWIRHDEPLPAALSRQMELASFIGLAAAALLVSAMTALWVRSR
jgi:hypothetical protein